MEKISDCKREHWEQYESDVWWEYFYALECHTERNVKGRLTYMPSPADIYRRRLELHWLEWHGFNDHFIASVMEHDMPCFERLFQMVERHGIEETYHRCLPFLADTEYEGET